MTSRYWASCWNFNVGAFGVKIPTINQLDWFIFMSSIQFGQGNFKILTTLKIIKDDTIWLFQFMSIMDYSLATSNTSIRHWVMTTLPWKLTHDHWDTTSIYDFISVDFTRTIIMWVILICILFVLWGDVFEYTGRVCEYFIGVRVSIRVWVSRTLRLQINLWDHSKLSQKWVDMQRNT